MKKLLFILLLSGAAHSQNDSLTTYQRQRAEAQKKKIERLAALKNQTEERAKKLGFDNLTDYYAWQEKRQRGKDQPLDGMQTATFGSTTCGVSKKAAKEAKKDWKSK